MINRLCVRWCYYPVSHALCGLTLFRAQELRALHSRLRRLASKQSEGSGTISFPQFFSFVITHSPFELSSLVSSLENQISIVFAALDVNNDGELTFSDEFQPAVACLCPGTSIAEQRAAFKHAFAGFPSAGMDSALGKHAFTQVRMSTNALAPHRRLYHRQLSHSSPCALRAFVYGLNRLCRLTFC
jgi:hypothetical protein